MDSPKHKKSDRSSMTTPKPLKKLYWPKFSEENSPKMCGFPEKQEEFGWDDSPEPLKFDPALITGNCKKSLDCNLSPVSSHPRKNIQRSHPPEPKGRLSPSADMDLARIQELSRRVLSGCTEFKTHNTQLSINSSTPVLSSESSESAISVDSPNICTILPRSDKVYVVTSLEKKSSNSSNASAPAMTVCKQPSPLKLGDKSLDNVVQSFYQEEEADEWLSQVEIPIEPRQTPSKLKFVKSLSDNQLESPGRSNLFRRTSSFQTASSRDQSSINNIAKSIKKRSVGEAKENSVTLSNTPPQPLKKQKSFHTETLTTQTQCTLQEIERKRLEAKYRREYKEIERKRLEAQKRLNERRARPAKDLVKR